MQASRCCHFSDSEIWPLSLAVKHTLENPSLQRKKKSQLCRETVFPTVVLQSRVYAHSFSFQALLCYMQGTWETWGRSSPGLSLRLRHRPLHTQTHTAEGLLSAAHGPHPPFLSQTPGPSTVICKDMWKQSAVCPMLFLPTSLVCLLPPRSLEKASRFRKPDFSHQLHSTQTGFSEWHSKHFRTLPQPSLGKRF